MLFLFFERGSRYVLLVGLELTVGQADLELALISCLCLCWGCSRVLQGWLLLFFLFAMPGVAPRGSSTLATMAVELLPQPSFCSFAFSFCIFLDRKWHEDCLSLTPLPSCLCLRPRFVGRWRFTTAALGEGACGILHVLPLSCLSPPSWEQQMHECGYPSWSPPGSRACLRTE